VAGDPKWPVSSRSALYLYLYAVYRFAFATRRGYSGQVKVVKKIGQLMKLRKKPATLQYMQAAAYAHGSRWRAAEK